MTTAELPEGPREMTKPVNPDAESYKHFLQETRNHALVVLHSEGLYRHLRVQAPGTRRWSWDVTTWPGHLATTGDVADGYVFAREVDMMTFFDRHSYSHDYYADGAPLIDVWYWAEKLVGLSSRDVKVYSQKIFLRRLDEHLAESDEVGTEAQAIHERRLALLQRLHLMRGLSEEEFRSLLDTHQNALEASLELMESINDLWSTDGLTEEQVYDLIDNHDWLDLSAGDIPRQSPEDRRAEILEDARACSDVEHEARQWLSENEDELEIFDSWEWDLTEYDIHFLFTCYAIDLAVQLFREHEATIERELAPVG